MQPTSGTLLPNQTVPSNKRLPPGPNADSQSLLMNSTFPPEAREQDTRAQPFCAARNVHPPLGSISREVRSFSEEAVRVSRRQLLLI
jgi:hypothetical protein